MDALNIFACLVFYFLILLNPRSNEDNIINMAKPESARTATNKGNDQVPIIEAITASIMTANLTIKETAILNAALFLVL